MRGQVRHRWRAWHHLLRAGLGLLAGVAAACGADLAPTALAIDPASAHQLEVTVPAEGIWEIKTTGVDPFIATLPFSALPSGSAVLTFEYICIGTVKPLEVFVGYPWRESQAQTAEALPYSEGWTEFSIDLRPALERTTVPPTRLRIDFGRDPGQVVQVRNLHLRSPDPREEEINRARVAHRASEQALAEEIQRYLLREHPARIGHVAVGLQEIQIAGELGDASGDCWLAEAPIWMQVAGAGGASPFLRVREIRSDAAGAFAVTVPRRVPVDGGMRDRLHTRWLILRREVAGDVPVSAARYADAVVARSELPPVQPVSKKGLGGFQAGRPELVGDLDTLGISSVTVNLFLSRLFRGRESARTEAFERNGRTYFADRTEFERLDRTLLAASARSALVFGILLVPKAGSWDTPELGRVMQHPDCEPAGTYSMANVTSAEGVEHYAALLDYVAERYSRPAQPFGRIHHWIVHNEVDAGWTWTNCGEKPPALFMDQYHKSMRLAHLIARQYDPHARAYASLTHYWTWTANFRYMPGRDVLKHLLQFSRVEGDFDWGIAHHPYPESLREPKTWQDKKAVFAFDSPLITFKNLEVLDAWVKLPAHRFLGRHVRSVHLTEQGPNSRDYSPTALAEQAASMAYVWQKIRVLDAIQGFQFHNWIDNRKEGGLRIGLRRFPDDPEAPLGPKPIWHVYRALDTPDEAAACAFALPLVGVKQWADVIHRGPITGEP